MFRVARYLRKKKCGTELYLKNIAYNSEDVWWPHQVLTSLVRSAIDTQFGFAI